MSEPLDFIEITEMFNGDKPTIHIIKLSDISETGLVIGRNENLVDICIGGKLKGSKMFAMLSSRHATLYKQFNPRRKSFDYFLRRGYRDRNGNWVELKADIGLDIFVGGKATDRFDPIELRIGALVELVPKLGSYQCKLHWGIVEKDPSQPPTIPVSENQLNELKFENRILKEQTELKENQVKQLQDVNARITEFVDKSEQKQNLLENEISIERKINKSQDEKIKMIRVYGGIVVASMAISLGFDIEEIERIAELCALLAGGGMFYTAVKK